MKHDINRWIFQIPLSDVQGDMPRGCNAGNNPCLLCGKELKDKKYVVHLLTTGNIVSTAESFGNDDQGFHFIGSDCAKKLPNNFIFKV